MTPIAVIRPDRQLEVLDGQRKRLWSTAPDPSLVWAGWGGAQAERALHNWPTWSPAGDRLASFRSAASGDGAELIVISEDGVRTEVVLDLQDRIPIYAQWSPDGKLIAVLYQHDQALGLLAVDPNDGEDWVLTEGSPLFFTWADDTHVAVFVGQGSDPVIGLLDVATRELDLFPGTPGHFCAPVQLGARTAYVAHRAGRVSLWLADRLAARELEPVNGLVAFLPDPNGGRLARAVAPDERSPYRGLSLVSSDGTVEPVDDEPITAFLWSPSGQHLVTAGTDARSGVVTFTSIRLLDGLRHHLGDVKPSRDLRFYLRFFEQFAQSHPLVDPEGRALLVPGELDRAGNLAGLWRLPLDGGAPDRLGDGLLGVWGPAG